MLDELGYTVTAMFNDLLLSIPNVIKAILILLVAWGVAVIAKAIFEKALVKIGAGRAIAKTPLVQDEEAGNSLLQNIGKLVYFLVFILFLPAVFNALNMTDVSTPISNMMSQFLNFIPNLVAATIIVVIGVFVAKLVKELFKSFFTTLNLDKWFRKISPEKADPAASQITLSAVLANIIYVVVLIPFITIGLEALNISTISHPVESVLNDVLGLIPNIFVAVILVVVGYYIGKLLGNLLTNLLDSVGFGKIFESLGFSNAQKPSTFNIARFLGTVVQVLIILFFTVEALNIINLHVLNTIGAAIIGYLPFILSSLVILAVGLFLANIVGNWVKNNTNSPFSAIILKTVIIVFAIFMTLEQLHFATSIVNKAFLLILGGLMVAFAISFGIGGRDFAAKQLEKVDRFIDKKDE